MYFPYERRKSKTFQLKFINNPTEKKLILLFWMAVEDKKEGGGQRGQEDKKTKFFNFSK